MLALHLWWQVHFCRNHRQILSILIYLSRMLIGYYNLLIDHVYLKAYFGLCYILKMKTYGYFGYSRSVHSVAGQVNLLRAG